MYTKRLNVIESISKEMLDELRKDYSYAGAWDSKDDVVKKFKDTMKTALITNQEGKCAYCELPLQTRNPEIEHIAPKGGPVRPKHIECTFLPTNLVYACHNCNSPECKGQKDTVVSKNNSENYVEWTFSIVHPYLDDPLEYFERLDIGNGILEAFPIPKINSDEIHKSKARNTIEMFKLNSEKCIEIAKEKIAQRHNDEMDKIVKSISEFRPF